MPVHTQQGIGQGAHWGRGRPRFRERRGWACARFYVKRLCASTCDPEAWAAWRGKKTCGVRETAATLVVAPTGTSIPYKSHEVRRSCFSFHPANLGWYCLGNREKMGV